MPDLNWTLLAEIEPGANWLLTGATTANLFKFEHHNPPRRALLQVAETDGQQWFFEPRTLSSDRDAQLLLLDHAAVFGGERRLSLRFADPSLDVRNWVVRVSATWIDLTDAMVVENSLSAIAIQVGAVATQLTAVQQSQATGQTELIALGTEQQAIAIQVGAVATQLTAVTSHLATVEAKQTQMATAINQMLAILTPPAPTPAPAPKASTTPYVASYSSAFPGYEPSYARLTDGNYSNGSLTNYGNSWIKASFPAPILVEGIGVGGGHDPNNGSLTLTGIQVQYSTNDTDWITLTTITGNYSTGNPLFSYQLASPITAQYWRLYKPADYVWISEFVFTP